MSGEKSLPRPRDYKPRLSLFEQLMAKNEDSSGRRERVSRVAGNRGKARSASSRRHKANKVASRTRVRQNMKRKRK